MNSFFAGISDQQILDQSGRLLGEGAWRWRRRRQLAPRRHHAGGRRAAAGGHAVGGRPPGHPAARRLRAEGEGRAPAAEEAVRPDDIANDGHHHLACALTHNGVCCYKEDDDVLPSPCFRK